MTVASFYTAVEAKLFTAFLESHQITCFLADENINSIHTFLSVATGGIKVNVHPSQFDEALRLYEEYTNGIQEDEDELAMKCPSCGSQILMLLPPEKSSYFNEYQCFDCDHMWDDKEQHNINPGHIE